MSKLYKEGRYPTAAELASLEFDGDGFSYWLGQDRTVPTGIMFHIVTKSHDAAGRPCVRTAGLIPYKQVSVEDRGVSCLSMAGEYTHHNVPSLYDAYRLIKTEWALSL